MRFHFIALAFALGLAACASSPTVPKTAAQEIAQKGEPITPVPAPRAMPERTTPTPPECQTLGRPDMTDHRPSYPTTALRANQEGWVMLRFDVEEGKVVHGKVLDSSPSGLFDLVALEWLRRLYFPSGKSVKSCQIEYVWKID